MNRIFFALLIIIGVSNVAAAQDCTLALSEADRLLSSGNVELVPATLNNCLNQLSREDRVEAYKKLTIAYLYMDDPFGAEKSFLALLNEDPEFRTSPSDPIELVYLSQQYITTPIISWSARAGANISTISVIHRNSAEAEYDDIKYKLGVGYNVAGALDLYFNKVVSLFLEGQVSMWQYNKVSSTFQYEPHDLTSKRFNYQASFPVGLKFTYPGEVSFPYVYGGYQPSYTYLSSVNNTRDPIREDDFEANGLNLTDQVNQFTNSAIVGIGYRRRIGKRFGYSYVLIDLRYRIGLTNVNNESTQFDLSNRANRDHITEFLQIEDDYRWNSLELSIGYVWPRYKPRKKNSVTIQTTMNKWFGKKNKDE